MINQFNCPECQARLNPKTLDCPQGHSFHTDQNGVLSLFTEQVRVEFAPFAKAISSRRQDGGYLLSDPGIYDTLPCNPLLKNKKEWQWRCDDLTIIRKFIGRLPNNTSKTILDVGAYNGWLSNNLAADGHSVTAVDYFAGEFDGLGAVKHYTHQWQPIQIDLTNLSPLNTQFEIVIMNHGLHFFPDPTRHLRQLLAKVTPDGLLIVIGLIIYRNPIFRKRYMERSKKTHQEQYGRSLLFRPTRGYLNYQDKLNIQDLGITLHSHPRFQFHNILSHVIPLIPWRGYGKIKKD